MSSPCCDTLDYFSQPVASVGTLTIALAGNPNSGKTTVFNALTGLRQKVANYPGVTVEKKTGRCKLPNNQWADVIDLPGTYSLISRSPDEQVAMEVLRGLRKGTKAPDVVIVVVDASNLQRNLYLVSQLIELGRPLVVALNMMDIAERRGLRVSAENLQKQLGVPVVPIVGYKRKGIAELKAAVLKATVAPLPDFALPTSMRDELLVVSGGLAILDSEDGAAFTHLTSLAKDGDRNIVDLVSKLPTSPIKEEDLDAIGPSVPRAWICLGDQDRRLDRYQAIAERLLIGDRAPDILPIAEHEPVASLLTAATSRLQALGIDPMQADVEAHYQWIEKVAHETVLDPIVPEKSVGTLSYETPPQQTLTQRVDAVLIHKVWGLLIFAGIMGLLFVTLFWLAQPMMDGIQAGIQWLGDVTTSHMSAGPLRDLLHDGVFNGVGTVVVFVPQIALLFLFLAILEDSGYLARAAFLMDRILSKVGLHGKSFIPLLSSFACAIPGIMATRTIENRRERLATILVAPFMSCSARLPVYTLLIGAFFMKWGHFAQAGIMLACYALGIVAAAGTAWFFKRTLTQGPATSFILELPSYKIPQVSQITRQVWVNTKAFLTKAGTTIFCLSVILWAMAYYPGLPGLNDGTRRTQWLIDSVSEIHIESAKLADGFYARTNPPGWEKATEVHVYREARRKSEEILASTALTQDEKLDELWKLTNPELKPILEERSTKAIAAAQSEYSISGHLGHFLEPAIRPLGFDWKMGVGLVSAFAAREVFVSSMGIVYSVGEVERGKTQDLATAMQNDRYTSGPRAGKPVWTPIVAISLLVWFVLAMQCMSTFAVVRRETGGWRWPIFMLVYMNALAYVVSLIVFQVGSHLFT